MSTSVLMPQMGESIAEGTIVRWIKKVGDAVDRDEPLFEISTDKVDAEIPSPAAGVLSAIHVREGETVAVNSVVATIGADADQAEAGGSAAMRLQPDGTAPAVLAPAEAEAPSKIPAYVTGVAAPAAGAAAPVSRDDRRRAKSSPLVRRIAREHNVDLAGLHGSGIGGRVTKHDILEFLERGSQSQSPGGQPGAATSSREQAPGMPLSQGSQLFEPGESTHVVPLSVMRKKIAEHMVASRRTSAHVHSVFEVNFHAVTRLRDQKKAEYERAGVKLTYMSFITKAVVDALRAMPVFNASLDDDKIVYKRDVNVGIAVALDWGLIVPVIKNADDKDLLGLSRAIGDLATRARAKQLKPEEVQGGTFTITNPGGLGAQFGLPIINQPQVAILGVGAIEKRAIVIDDAIAIRPMAYLALGFDHRLIDGAVADQFMAFVKRQIEQFDPAGV